MIEREHAERATLAPGSAPSCTSGPDGRVYVVAKDGEMRADAGLRDP